MPDSHPPQVRNNTPHMDNTKLSMWTVVGAVAASVMTAGILGGASGILQVPAIVTEVAAIRAKTEIMTTATSNANERLRSSELVVEGLQRQINDITARNLTLLTKIEKQDYDNRTLDITTQKELAAVEGRSKERNTEVKGEVNSVRSELGGLSERVRTAAEVQNQVRQNVYDLATRLGRSQILQNQSVPVPGEQLPYSSPYKNNDFHTRPPERNSPHTDATYTGR